MEKRNKLTLHEILWYFIIFSVIGLLIETLYCYITTGVLESRKGLIWGPFCPVYGVGAVILIAGLNETNTKNYFKLFIYGFFIGAILEYFMSYVLESIYSTRFWDYTYTGNSINGRICIIYSIFWGFLAIFLSRFAKPNIDKIINRIPKIYAKIIDIVIVIFLIIDICITIWGIRTYEQRATNRYYKIEMNEKNDNIKNMVENNYFTTERMKKTFPNLRIKDEYGRELYIKNIL